MRYEKSDGLEDKIKSWQEPDFSEGANGVLMKRYLLRDERRIICETPKELLYRVAHVLSEVDRIYGDKNPEETEKEFYEAMAERRFFPNSPTLKGAGRDINLSACYVVQIEDSREGIFGALQDAVSIQAYGGGTGFNFSEIRPEGSPISTTGGQASGPISFIGAFDYVVGPVIAQGGTRNGANMGILNYDHPDIEQFLTCKAQGGLKNFNISVGVTEGFMRMVEKDEEYKLQHLKWGKERLVKAKEIYHKIIENAWKNGDPGIIFLDRLERDNPTPDLGKIVATNPCGEQPLLPFEACDLGSINLAVHVKENKEKRELDYEKLRQTIHTAVHFLDNIIDANVYPLKKTEKEQDQLRRVLQKTYKDQSKIEKIVEAWAQSPIEKIVKGNRKIGLGVMGFADLIAFLGVGYGTLRSQEIAEEVMGFIDAESKRASEKLAETRGVFPNWEGSIFDPKSKHYRGKNLRLRHATTTTIAPTGTLSTLAGCEGGIEPLFAVAYKKKAGYDQEGNPTIEFITTSPEFERIAKEEGFYYEGLEEEIYENGGSLKNIKKPDSVSKKRWEELIDIFTTANELPVEYHIGIQSAFQKHLDNAASKTINMPKEAPREWVERAYQLAYKHNLKGVTIYRDGSIERQVKSTGKTSSLEEESTRPEVIGKTVPQKTPQGKAYVTLNVLEEDNSKPYEAFISIGKGGRDMSAIGEGYGRLVSLAFKKGVPIEEIISQLDGIGGETQIFSKEKITSLPDALAKGLKELYEKLTHLKLDTKKEGFTGNFCQDCGGEMHAVGGCPTCVSCGFSKC